MILKMILKAIALLLYAYVFLGLIWLVFNFHVWNLISFLLVGGACIAIGRAIDGRVKRVSPLKEDSGDESASNGKNSKGVKK